MAATASDLKTSSHIHTSVQEIGATEDCKADNSTYTLPTAVIRDPSPNSAPGSPSKTARKPQGSWISKWTLLGFHIPSLALSAVLIWANSVARFWFDINTDMAVSGSWSLSPNTVLHLLQLAAKVYGLFLVLSLSTIILSMYRSTLTSAGLPLGFISTGYRTGDLAYLKSPELWAAMSSHPRYTAFGLILIAGTLLAALSEPACAILAVPTPGWYPYQAKSRGSVIYLIPNTTTWPSIVDRAYAQYSDRPWICLTSISTDVQNCPGRDYNYLSDWAAHVDGDPVHDKNLSITVAGSNNNQLHQQVFIDKPSNSSATLITTLSSIPVRTAAEYFDYLAYYDFSRISRIANFRIQSKDGSFQPLSQAKCEVFDLDSVREADRNGDTAGYPYFPMEGIRCFDDARCASWQSRSKQERVVDRRYWDYTRRINNVSFSWVETEGPLSAVFNMPFLRKQGAHNATGAGAGGGRQAFYFVACSFVSRWIPATVIAHLPQSDRLETNVSNMAAFLQDEPDKSMMGYPVHVSTAWADFLNFNLSFSSDVSDLGILSTCQDFVPGYGAMTMLLYKLINCYVDDDRRPIGYSGRGNNDTNLTARAVERVTGAALVAGLSRVGLRDSWNSLESASRMVFQITPERIVYNYLTLVTTQKGKLNNITLVANPGNSTYPTKEIFNFAGGVATLNHNITMDEGYAQFLAAQHFEFDIERYGYGSGTPSPTLTFAMVIICLYIAAVAIYAAASVTVILYRFRKKVVVPSTETHGNLDDIHDLIVVAWNSHPAQRADPTGTVIAEPSLYGWKQIVTVRDESGEGLRLMKKSSPGWQRAT